MLAYPLNNLPLVTTFQNVIQNSRRLVSEARMNFLRTGNKRLRTPFYLKTAVLFRSFHEHSGKFTGYALASEHLNKEMFSRRNLSYIACFAFQFQVAVSVAGI